MDTRARHIHVVHAHVAHTLTLHTLTLHMSMVCLSSLGMPMSCMPTMCIVHFMSKLTATCQLSLQVQKQIYNGMQLYCNKFDAIMKVSMSQNLTAAC